jgi:hypothetical protein
LDDGMEEHQGGYVRVEVTTVAIPGGTVDDLPFPWRPIPPPPD